MAHLGGQLTVQWDGPLNLGVTGVGEVQAEHVNAGGHQRA